MKFKVGDKVRIKENLIVGKFYGGLLFLDCMSKFKGTKNKILDTTIGGNYILNGNDFSWSEDMLELVEQEQQTPFSISITSDGIKTVKGTYVNGKEIKESEAKCNLDEDTFDISTGVQLVLERLGIKKRCTCELNKNKEVKPKNKVLKFKGEEDVIGEKTSLVDIYGRELYVGDLVKVYIDDKCAGEYFVRKECNSENKYYINFYYTTLSSQNLDFKDGKNLNNVYGRIIIVKSKSYEKLKPGDTDDHLKVIEVEE